MNSSKFCVIVCKWSVWEKIIPYRISNAEKKLNQEFTVIASFGEYSRDMKYHFGMEILPNNWFEI